MSTKALIESWNNGWLASISEPYKDENNNTWLDVKFSQPTNTKPIPTHFVSVRFRLEDGKPVTYLVECDKTEKEVSYAITDATLKMYLRIKSKGGACAQALGLIE